MRILQKGGNKKKQTKFSAAAAAAGENINVITCSTERLHISIQNTLVVVLLRVLLLGSGCIIELHGKGEIWGWR